MIFKIALRLSGVEGVKVTSTSRLLFGVNLKGVVDTLKTELSTERLSTERSALPLFCMVNMTFCVCPSRTPPKLREVGFVIISGVRATPTPDNLTPAGLSTFLALCESKNTASFVPLDFGRKVTATLALCPPVNVTLNVVDASKSVSLIPAGSTLTAKLPPPEFVTVMVSDFALPMVTVPKLIEDGEIERTGVWGGGVTCPATAVVTAPSWEVSEIEPPFSSKKVAFTNFKGYVPSLASDLTVKVMVKRIPLPDGMPVAPAKATLTWPGVLRLEIGVIPIEVKRLLGRTDLAVRIEASYEMVNSPPAISFASLS